MSTCPYFFVSIVLAPFSIKQFEIVKDATDNDLNCILRRLFEFYTQNEKEIPIFFQNRKFTSKVRFEDVKDIIRYAGSVYQSCVDCPTLLSGNTVKPEQFLHLPTPNNILLARHSTFDRPYITSLLRMFSNKVDYSVFFFLLFLRACFW